MESIERMPPPVRRLQRVVHRGRDVDHVRRPQAILHLTQRLAVSAVAGRVVAAHSTVYHWRRLCLEGREGRLLPRSRGRTQPTVFAPVVARLLELVATVPRYLAYLRTPWNSQLLALELKGSLGVDIHASTIRRLLRHLGYHWRRRPPDTAQARLAQGRAPGGHCQRTARL